MKTMLTVGDLNLGSYYLGRGRNGNVALWDGDVFLVVCSVPQRRITDDGKIVYGPERRAEMKREGHYDTEYGCFQPFVEINEGKGIPYQDERRSSLYCEYLVV
jgi:hypothetical protein